MTRRAAAKKPPRSRQEAAKKKIWYFCSRLMMSESEAGDIFAVREGIGQQSDRVTAKHSSHLQSRCNFFERCGL